MNYTNFDLVSCSADSWYNMLVLYHMCADMAHYTEEDVDFTDILEGRFGFVMPFEPLLTDDENNLLYSNQDQIETCIDKSQSKNSMKEEVKDNMKETGNDKEVKSDKCLNVGKKVHNDGKEARDNKRKSRAG